MAPDVWASARQDATKRTKWLGPRSRHRIAIKRPGHSPGLGGFNISGLPSQVFNINTNKLGLRHHAKSRCWHYTRSQESSSKQAPIGTTSSGHPLQYKHGLMGFDSGPGMADKQKNIKPCAGSKPPLACCQLLRGLGQNPNDFASILGWCSGSSYQHNTPNTTGTRHAHPQPPKQTIEM